MLKEIHVAVSAISTLKDVYGTIILHIMVDYRDGIFPFNVKKCDVYTDTLLPHGAAEVSFQHAQPSK